MAVTLPQILVSFKQLASSFITRSARGIAVLIVRDGTAGGDGYKTYTDATELSGAPYTAANIQAVKDALSFGPLRVGVAKVGTGGTLAEALALVLENEKTGWLTVVGGTPEDWSDLVSWTKAREAAYKSWKTVVFDAAAPDCMHVVNLVNAKVIFSDSRGEQDGDAYTPSLVGLLAACNVEQGSTNKLCANLSHVSMPDNPDAAVGSGKFLLVNDDDEVRVGVDVNSLITTNGSTRTEDMKYIETVEAMDLIRDDITAAYKQDYLGKYRNTLTNQMLFVAAINYYFEGLEDTVLDGEYANAASINVEAQRAAWVGSGKSEAADWDDATVRSMTFKRNLYLQGDVKILGSMVNLSFDATLA
ncbi:phage tail sheath C-terminal domain-containing protein [uncultured Oscillibacter sp.]|uniref:phage tail sheath C-terminal domain-containing protein n=1 Tax=uncultured Oscillibacter sp. TaxID=876091 RepID=UPI0025E9A1D2|nr:phage tail sheath C-terminal domain-containing protein [uncultured Oscillibacter sp.]